ncbi:MULTISPECIES: S8 family serine peptidase [Planktothrix]|uniref:Peptidase S8 and S53, subtilisin, kexin, sedolisin n=2 Tax=Planktothrix TaxID=54304 RepID=A0A6J7ZG76_PLARU|nr:MULTISPECIES: S8 family serine peptidase [Planktothrix]CAC5340377.1 Peptidase S8 and S53, subtilisin, kexin, sedolisin [Planktothrix rubescens NIVA-CYA 18]CAD5943059.1 Peptidase S8 and S53, subtilisin, kexin, sedolisin [Planktothrix rubescens NIVA-CYA 18]
MNDPNSNVPPIVYAEASVNSQGGVSLFRSSELITSENITQFYSRPQQVNLAIQRLKAEGFEVLETGRVTLSIAGSADLYERVFNTQIIAKDKTVIKGGGLESIGTFLDTPDTDIIGFVDTSSSPLSDLIEGIALSEPVYYTDVGRPSESPPNPSYWHLIPQDIAQELNAVTAHQQGIKGQGINVVMVDSGWYSHPFFARNRYRGKVILAAGCINPEVDENGHGTGESANLFSVAPEINFTMVKGNFKNSIAAFKKAVSLRPDIVSCSWGSSKQYAPLSAYDIALTANIADAVYQGIIVVFSAGNGHWGFPSQHPDVIAAGGVYLDSDGKLEASNYASGFSSNIYSGRIVPDICGLVGKKPRAAYIILPVPPGSTLDAVFGLPGVKHPDADETLSEDGWAAFSGTSAAAPQLAGICALMKQVNPQLSSQQAKEILQQTAIDVIAGNSNSATGGHSAKPGFDWATGRGLVNGFEAVKTAQRLAKNSHSPKQQPNQQPNFLSQKTPINLTEVTMDSKLRKHYEKILCALDEALQNVDDEIKNEYELVITPANFVPRSPISKAAYQLMTKLNDENTALKAKVFAAQGLLKLGRYQEEAIKVLTDLITDESKIPAIENIKDRSELLANAMEALGEASSHAQNNSNSLDDDPMTTPCCAPGTSCK